MADMAVAPRAPYAPRLSLNLAIGLVLSLLAGAAAIFLLELRDTGFADSEQAEKALQLPVLGMVPAVAERRLRRAMADPRSAFSEGYRSVRMSLQFSGPQGIPGVILVTSCEAGEGKSTTVCRLARDLGILGARVMVVDANMRQPALHGLFDIDNAAGLANLLAATLEQDEFPRLIRPVAGNVSMMTAGAAPPHPTDLLSTSRMKRLLHRLAQSHDVVIIDSAPVGGFADTCMLSRMADATLLVVAANGVRRNAARQALRRMLAAGANVTGIVFTKYPARRPAYGHITAYPGRGGEGAARSDGVGQRAIGHPAWGVRQTG